MDFPPLLVDVKLVDLLKSYYVSGMEDINYLWTLFFKVDGESVSVGPGAFVQGSAAVTFTPGNHGDLSDDDSVENPPGGPATNVDLPIPSSLGEFQTRLTSIPIDPSLMALTGRPSLAGYVGCVAVILEQNDTPDDAVAAGHQAFNTSFQQQLNAAISDLNVGHTTLTQADIAQIDQNIQDAVEQAIKNSLSDLDKLWTALGIENQDREIDAKYFTFGQDALVAAPSGALPIKAIVARRGYRPPSGPANSVFVEWVLTGQVSAHTPFWTVGSGTISPGASQEWSFTWGGDGDVGPQLIQAEPMNASGELATTQIGESRDITGSLIYHATVENQGSTTTAFQWRGGGR